MRMFLSFQMIRFIFRERRNKKAKKSFHMFKGQMNQNLNIFSLAILKRRNVKQNIQKETYAEIFLYEP